MPSALPSRHADRRARELKVASNEQAEFADFFRASWEPCLRAVLAVAGSPQLAEDQVAEAVRQGLGVVAEDPQGDHLALPG